MNIQSIAPSLFAKPAQPGIISMAKRLTFPIQHMHLHPSQPLLMGDAQQILWQDLLHTHIEMKGVSMQVKGQVMCP
ncbi:hypothetical protein D3C77_760500 [compost metagenome]